MRTAVIALTSGGAIIARQLAAQLRPAPDLFLPPALAAPGESSKPVVFPLSRLVASLWPAYQALVLVMASGIAVRVTAPLLTHKSVDPAVVVCDENGDWSIPLVGGHWAGGNDLARAVARVTAGQAVITTATDAQGMIGADVLARSLRCRLEPWDRLARVNARLLQGETVPVYAEEPVPALLLSRAGFPARPLEMAVAAGFSETALVLSTRWLDLGHATPLYLRPPLLSVGIGCRRGTGSRELLEAIDCALGFAGRSFASVACLASLTRKGDETGLRRAARQRGLPLRLFSEEDLNRQHRQSGLETYPEVHRRMGVYGVCEPAALLGLPQTRLVQERTVQNGTTVAVAQSSYRWWESGREPRTS